MRSLSGLVLAVAAAVAFALPVVAATGGVADSVRITADVTDNRDM